MTNTLPDAIFVTAARAIYSVYQELDVGASSFLLSRLSLSSPYPGNSPLFGDVDNTIAIWSVKVKSLSTLTASVRPVVWTQFS